MDVLSKPAEEFDNDQLVEEMWAMKAFEHSEIYFNLLCSVDPRELRLTPFDDQIYSVFRQDFPDLKVGILNEEELKSPTAKENWRTFIAKFDKLDDFSFGTLLRADASKEFSPDNSIFVVRVQFLAIEIARNREGFNDNLKQFYKPPPKEEEEK